jgi:hypothetical protein
MKPRALRVDLACDESAVLVERPNLLGKGRDLDSARWPNPEVDTTWPASYTARLRSAPDVAGCQNVCADQGSDTAQRCLDRMLRCRLVSLRRPISAFPIALSGLMGEAFLSLKRFRRR